MDFDLPEPLPFCFELATLPVARVFAHSVLHMDLQKSFPMCCGHSTDRCNAWPTAPGDRGTSAAKMAAICEAPEVVARSTTTRGIKGWQHSLRHLVVVKWTWVVFDSSEKTNQEKNARYRIFHSVRNCILYNCRIRFTDLYRSLQKYWYRIFNVRRSIYTLYCGLFHLDPNSQFLAQHRVSLQININKQYVELQALG